MKTSEKAINTDFYESLFKKLKKIDGAITYNDGNIGWFNPELVKIALDMMLNELKIDVLYEHTISNLNKEKGEILSVYIKSIHDDNILVGNKVLSLPIETIHLVDATGDAKICQKLNCKFIPNFFEF